MIAETFNETARFRASFHGRCGAGYEPPEMTDPAVLAEQAKAEAAHAIDREEVEAELFRGFGRWCTRRRRLDVPDARRVDLCEVDSVDSRRSWNASRIVRGAVFP